MFRTRDGTFLDVPLLLRGVVSLTPLTEILAVSILRGEEYPITRQELDALLAVPSDGWTNLDEALATTGGDAALLTDLAEKGLLILDLADEPFVTLRARDERLAAEQWHLYAALFHFMTKWTDVEVGWNLFDTEAAPEEAGQEVDPMREMVRRFGAPPGPFHERSPSIGTVELPIMGRSGGLYEALSRRKTTRDLDPAVPMMFEALATILWYVWGCHGYATITDDLIGLKKTSPSGGGLHPTEVYPLILNVDGLQPGLYHYSVREHALNCLVNLSREQAEEWASEFAARQEYVRTAGALFVMTSRFYRAFWKYRQHAQVFRVLLMDAAHLSQTFYLVCTDLGLGAFVTAAVNATNVERRLALDGFAEGAIAICGCGAPRAGTSRLDPRFLPFVPRTTDV